MSQRIDDEDPLDEVGYQVVVNDEEQYSIWPLGRELPLGWRAAGKEGPKAECLAYIDEVWTDMRPLSLRKSMESSAEGAS
jgi:MbtH protein